MKHRDPFKYLRFIILAVVAIFISGFVSCAMADELVTTYNRSDGCVFYLVIEETPTEKRLVWYAEDENCQPPRVVFAVEWK